MKSMNQETTILWTEITDFPEGWGIKKHSHKDYYHLFYFVKGTGTFFIGEKKYDITPGVCFLLPPDTVHGLEISTVEELSSYEIKFNIHDTTLRERLSEGIMCSEEGDFISTCVRFIHQDGLSHDPGKRRNANYFLCALLARIADGHTGAEHRDSELIDTSAYSDTVVSIIIYIETNYMHHIYLDDIAQYIEYNRNYMCSLFKKDTGITVVDYLNYVRIRKACEYILYSDIGFSQICYRVGFLNLSHFNRTFKNLVGTTPSAYSKMVDMNDNNLFPKNSAEDSGLHSYFPSVTQAIAALHISDS